MNNEAEPPATLLGAAATFSAHPDGAATAAGPSRTRPHRHRHRHHHHHHQARQPRARLTHSKIQFLGQLQRSIDVIIYYYFAYMYFLDTSFLRFLLRSSVQLNCLTPKPANFPISPQRRSVIFGIFGTAAFCALNHIVFAAPEAGEASGGYLHGGFIIDFVGQESPVSKLRLLTTDAIILILQIFMLSINLERQKLRVEQSASTASTATQTAQQDHDSEERGELRAVPDHVHDSSTEEEGDNDDDDDDNDDNEEDEGDEEQESQEDSRSQSRQEGTRQWRRRSPVGVDGGNGREGNGAQDERQHLLSDDNQRGRQAEESAESEVYENGRYDAFSGHLVVANLRLIDAIRYQWTHGTPIAGGALGSNNGTIGPGGASATGVGDSTASRLSALAQLSRRGTGL